MAGDNDKDKKGFSGLLDLVSEISDINEPIKPEPKVGAKPPTPKQPPQRETAPSEPERKTTSSPPPIETVRFGKSGGGSGGKWGLGIISVIFVIWLINNGGQSNKKTSYAPPSSSQGYSYPQSPLAPAVQTLSATQSHELQYTKPSVGTSNVLSIQEIRYCVREKIRIEAIRNILSNSLIDKYNEIVNDYNIRCGSYRYYGKSQTQAENDVEPFRSAIISEAIQELKNINNDIQNITLQDGKPIYYRNWSAKLYWGSIPIVDLLSSDNSGNSLLVSFSKYRSLFFRMVLSTTNSYIPSQNEQRKINIYIDNKYIITSTAKLSRYEQKLQFEIDINFQQKLLELFKKGKEIQFYLENEDSSLCRFSLYGFTRLYNAGISELYKN